MNKIVALLSLVGMITLISGCATAPPPPPPWSQVGSAFIATEGVEIRAEDGSFHWKAGEVFTVRRQVSVAWWKKSPPKASYDCSNCEMVRVKVPGRTKELYGQMRFARMHPDATGPGARSYRIEVPQKYVNQAMDGQRSVVYEWVKHTDGAKQTSWVLWLSDLPIR